MNAKYIHVNLAVRSLAGYARERVPGSVRISIAEYTINHRPDFLFRELCALQADVLAFSCYIWNIELIQGLLADLKQVRPSMRIVLGGPEVSYDAEQVLLANPAVDCVICGEGERSFTELVCRLADSTDFTGVCGIAARKNGRILQNPPQPPLDLAALPLPMRILRRIPTEFCITKRRAAAPTSVNTAYLRWSRACGLNRCPLCCGSCSGFGRGRTAG
ncbi:MAG: B12-binding domain-containing radical SAM protein [Oscillospiraceae bacterium]